MCVRTLAVEMVSLSPFATVRKIGQPVLCQVVSQPTKFNPKEK